MFPISFGRRAARSALCLMLLGCGSPGPSASPDAVPVPWVTVASAPPGVLLVCDEALLSGFLAADPADPRLVWLVGRDGSRIDVNWPRGFAVRFDPEPALITPAGGVDARAGQREDLVGGFSSRDGHFYACEVNGRDWAGYRQGDTPPPTTRIRVLP